MNVIFQMEAADQGGKANKNSVKVIESRQHI